MEPVIDVGASVPMARACPVGGRLILARLDSVFKGSPSRGPGERDTGGSPYWWHGLLWASLAAVAGALGLETPEAAGYPALAIGWVLTRMIWRARETR